MKEKIAVVAKAQMLIRKPVGQVLEALVDPAITSRFWFSESAAGWSLTGESDGTGKCMVVIPKST